MFADGTFGFPKITFDCISGHFRSKWPPAAILNGTTMSIIELVRDIWMSNACVNFEERSINPSKVMALTTKSREYNFCHDILSSSEPSIEPSSDQMS